MDKKIGILTFHAADNYGAVLQAYALQHYLENKGAHVEIIDFVTPQVEKANNIFFVSKRGVLSKWIVKGLILLHYRKLKRRKDGFDHFRQTYLHLSRRFTSVEDIKTNGLGRHVYITGSDQVFNPLIKNAEIYYLGFETAKVTKVAYAPSFGIKDFTLVDEKIRNYIKEFDYLSCREKDGAEFLAAVCGRPVPVVADPVFLVDVMRWKNILPAQKLKNYVFVYDLNGGKSLIRLANKVKQATGLPVICLTARKYTKGRYNVDKLCYDSSPCEFLSYISGADYVVTDSFHGLAFSLLFKTKVISYVALPMSASRIYSIMDCLDLTRQIVEDVDKFKMDTITFPEYGSKLDKLIADSKCFLDRI